MFVVVVFFYLLPDKNHMSNCLKNNRSTMHMKVVLSNLTIYFDVLLKFKYDLT